MIVQVPFGQYHWHVLGFPCTGRQVVVVVVVVVLVVVLVVVVVWPQATLTH